MCGIQGVRVRCEVDAVDKVRGYGVWYTRCEGTKWGEGGTVCWWTPLTECEDAMCGVRAQCVVDDTVYRQGVVDGTMDRQGVRIPYVVRGRHRVVNIADKL